MRILVIDPDYRIARNLRTTLGDCFRDLIVLHVQRVDRLREQVADLWQEALAAKPALAEAPEAQALTNAQHSSAEPSSRGNSTPTNSPTWPSQSFTLDLTPHELTLLDLRSALDAPAPTAILGYDVQRFRERPDFWRSIVAFEDRKEFAEALKRAQREDRRDGQVRLLDVDGRLHSANWQISLTTAHQDPQISLPRCLTIAFQTEPTGQSITEANSHALLDMIFVSSECLPLASLSADLQSLRNALAHYGPDGAAPPIIVTTHDLSDLERRAYLNAQITDVIFKPIDDSLLLQKLSRLIPNAPRLGESDFLFSLKGTFDFDIGEELAVSGFNDLGIRLSHRKPMRTGQRIRVRTPILNPIDTPSPSSEVLWLHVRSSLSVADGERVRTETTFFGLPSEQQAKLRTRLEASLGPAFHKPRVLQETQPSKTKPNFIVHGDEPQQEPQRLFINLDLDDESQDRLRQMTELSYPKNRVVSFDTPAQALQVFRERSSNSASEAFNGRAREVRPAFFPNQPIEIRLSSTESDEDFGLSDLTSGSKDKAMIFGYPATEALEIRNFFDRQCDEPERWRDFLRFVSGGQKASRVFRMISKFDTFFEVRIEAQPTSSEPPRSGVSLQLRMIDVTLQNQSSGPIESLDTSLIDAVVIDAAYFRSEVSPLLQAVRQSLRSPEVRFIITGRPTHGLTLDDFAKCPEVSALVPKPFDRRALESALNPYPTLTEPIEHKKSWADHLKSIHVDTIGEYGLEFISPAPIPQGAWAHFSHRLLHDGTGRGILGRCFASDPIAVKQFRHRFLFYAVRDEALR
jgi:CheY-like chemotaxis protein